MKKRISARAICLIVAAAMLMGALTVSAINGSPYENLKNAAFNALFYDNVTIEAEFTLRIDGEVHEVAWTRQYIGNDSSLSIAHSESPWRASNNIFVPRQLHIISYQSHELVIDTSVTTSDGVQWYSVRRNRNNFGFNSIGYEIFGPAGRNSNQLRLAEIMIDLFVGDLKNNLTISAYGDGVRRVSGAITESQLPEIVRVLIAIGMDAIEADHNARNRNFQREDFNHIMDIPPRNISIDRIAGHADIDNNGNLLFINGMAIVTMENIFGDVHLVEVEATASFTDIGTTVPENPFPGSSAIFTEELFREFFDNQQWWRTLYFTLDANGNIDIDSITGQWPTSRAQNAPIQLSPTGIAH